MPRAMISYRNIDGQREFAQKLEQALSNAGIETWLDSKDIPPLSRWEDEIFKGIINSDFVILCLSPDYFESETCLFECYIARGYGKTLIPIIAPYQGDASIFDLINQHEATRGVDHLNIVSFHTREILGLLEDSADVTRRVIKAILQPTPPDEDYDVYFSFRWTQAHFATQISDDLNKAGIKSFIHTRAIDVGADWRRASWNAALKSHLHIVILSPDVILSQYIVNEVLISRTRKGLQFIPILATEFVNDEAARDTIRRTFADSKNLAVLNDIQWLMPRNGYEPFIAQLIEAVKARLQEGESIR